MDAIFGSDGAVVAWLDRGERVFGLRGQPLGWVQDTAVYAIRTGGHVGWLESGLFRDNSGQVVAFMDGASGGPSKPAKHVKPVKPVRSVWPVKPVRHVRNVRAAKSSSWSRLTFDAWIAEGR